MKVAFLTRSMDPGGAERQLAALSTGLKNLGCEVSMLEFYGGGKLETVLKAAGVAPVHLGKRGRSDVLGFLSRLGATLRATRPDVVYSCLPGPNICAALVRPFLRPRPKLVFRIAASYVDLARYDRLARVSYRLEQYMARFCDLVISNSEAGLEYAAKRGFPVQKLVVLPNGFDVEHFRPRTGDRLKLRGDWGVPGNAPLIGLVARLDPMKDHMTFMEAAALLARKRADVRFVCAGGGDASYAGALRSAADRLGLENRLIWIGEVDDVRAVYNAVDVATCSSYGEGFPNVIGEAMACGTPCVVTDVGDNAVVVGNTGEVVKAGSPASLAEGWLVMLRRLEREGQELKDLARRRIVENYSTEKLAADTLRVLERLAGPVQGRAHA